MMDDASYVQQSWDQGVNNEQIKEILTQFTNTQELLKLQMNIFGVSEKHLDPHLQTPNLSVLSMNDKKETGKRVERSSDHPVNPVTKKKRYENQVNEDEIIQGGSAKTAQSHVLNERQRRLKMNQKIQSLKELLPKSCADILSNKLAILHESVQHIKNLHVLVDQLNDRNQYLEQRLATVEKELCLHHLINNQQNANFMSNNMNAINSPSPSPMTMSNVNSNNNVHMVNNPNTPNNSNNPNNNNNNNTNTNGMNNNNNGMNNGMNNNNNHNNNNSSNNNNGGNLAVDQSNGMPAYNAFSQYPQQYLPQHSPMNQYYHINSNPYSLY